jgi:hypothetical protein
MNVAARSLSSGHHRRRRANLAVVRGTLVLVCVLTLAARSNRARACSPGGCSLAVAYPSDGVLVPANLSRLTYLPGRNSFNGAAAKPDGFELWKADGTLRSGRDPARLIPTSS